MRGYQSVAITLGILLGMSSMGLAATVLMDGGAAFPSDAKGVSPMDVLWTEDAANNRLYTTTSSRLVGIGTSTATEKLHVYGSGAITGRIESTNSDANLRLKSTATNAHEWVFQSLASGEGTGPMRIYDVTAGASRLLIDTGGTTHVAYLQLDNNPLGTCDASNAGKMDYVAGAAGVADSISACLKSAAGTYNWIPFAKGG